MVNVFVFVNVVLLGCAAGLPSTTQPKANNVVMTEAAARAAYDQHHYSECERGYLTLTSHVTSTAANKGA